MVPCPPAPIIRVEGCFVTEPYNNSEAWDSILALCCVIEFPIAHACLRTLLPRNKNINPIFRYICTLVSICILPFFGVRQAEVEFVCAVWTVICIVTPYFVLISGRDRNAHSFSAVIRLPSSRRYKLMAGQRRSSTNMD